MSKWPEKQERLPLESGPVDAGEPVRLSNSQLKEISEGHLKEISRNIEETYQRRIQLIQEHAKEAQSIPLSMPGVAQPDLDLLDHERRMGHLDALSNEHNNVLISQEISNYRLRRLHHQRQLEQLVGLENEERRELQENLDKERGAYEKTKMQLCQLQKRIKKLRKKNRKEAKTQRQIDFLIN